MVGVCSSSAMPLFHTSHGRMPGHWHWWCLLYCVVLWCGVSETTERRMPPSFTAVDPVYPYLAFLPVPVRFPGAKLAAAHHSFHGFVAHCMTLEHNHELSARGFIECGFGGGLILWCGVAGLLCLYGSWVHHQVTRPLDRAVRLNARATPNPLMDTRSQLDPISSIKPLLSLNLNPASGKPSRPFLSKNVNLTHAIVIVPSTEDQ